MKTNKVGTLKEARIVLLPISDFGFQSSHFNNISSSAVMLKI